MTGAKTSAPRADRFRAPPSGHLFCDSLAHQWRGNHDGRFRDRRQRRHLYGLASKFCGVSLKRSQSGSVDFGIGLLAALRPYSFLGFAEPDECHRREFFLRHGDVEWGSSSGGRCDALQQHTTAARCHPARGQLQPELPVRHLQSAPAPSLLRLLSASPEPTAARPDRLRSA